MYFFYIYIWLYWVLAVGHRSFAASGIMFHCRAWLLQLCGVGSVVLCVGFRAHGLQEFWCDSLAAPHRMEILVL